MNTQIIFNIDTKLKMRAMKKAKEEGIPLASLYKFATKAYVDGGLSVGLVEEKTLNARTRREITKALEDIKQGKNLSPRFTNAKDAIAYLKR